MQGGKSSIEVGLRRRPRRHRGRTDLRRVSGYFGGALDAVLMRLVDIGLAIPVVFLFIFMAQIFKPSLTLLIVLLTIVSWLIPAASCAARRSACERASTCRPSR